MRMEITLQHIADDLRLSKSTVSRSLRNDPLIKPKTRAKVQETAARLGYEGRSGDVSRQVGVPRLNGVHPEEVQGQMASAGTPGGLGLLFPAPSVAHAQNDLNFVHIMQGIMSEAERLGLLLMVNTIPLTIQGHLEEYPSEVPSMIREGACQALILRGVVLPADVAFLSAKLPVVSITQLYPEFPVDSVVPDNVNGISAVVRRLKELGHRKLAWVGYYYDASFLEAREVGFLHGCRRNGLAMSDQRFFGAEIYDDRFICGEDKLLEAVRTGTTAMVCGNDFIAWQVIEILERHGVRVPDDVSVSGFDAEPPVGVKRRITSINPNFTEIGRAAVRLASQRLSNRSAPPCILSVRGQFVEGETVAQAR